MCGPVGFDALHTCMIRIYELSAAGFTTYAFYKTASLCRDLRLARKTELNKHVPNLPKRLSIDGSHGSSAEVLEDCG